MRDKEIPLKTVYHSKKSKLWTTKEPLYRLKSKQEEKEYQESLGRFLHFYYGVDMYKCCGVYPKFMTEQTLNGYGYYICLVCGKEGKHEPMQWLAKKSWQDMNKPYEQISIFELMK